MSSTSCRFSPTREWRLCNFPALIEPSLPRSTLLILAPSLKTLHGPSRPTRTRSTSCRNSSMSKWRLAPSYAQLTVFVQEDPDDIVCKVEGSFKRDNDESLSQDHQTEMVEVAVPVWNAEFGVHAFTTPLFFFRGGHTFTVCTLR